MGEKKKTAHQALYRKYRSKSLDEIVGQEHITTTLASAIKQGKINHAYLFTGPRGTGKTSIARILAHEINKLPYQDDATHLDIVEIDAASNRRIDDIRDLRDKVQIAPISAKYKVYIIDEVHMLTNESFNALLKTLEEPPEHVIFILATTEVHKLPATIISRAQRHSFRLIPLDKVVNHLSAIAKKEKITIDSAALQLLAEHGGGSFRDSISLLDQMSASDEPITTELIELLLGLAPQASLESLLTSVKQGEAKEILHIVSELLASGLTPSAIAEQLLKIIRKEIQENGSRVLAQLMHELLSVQSAQYPKLKLESVLINSALTNTPQAPEQPVKHQPTVAAQPRQTESVANARKIVEEKPVSTKKPKQTASEPEKKQPETIKKPETKNTTTNDEVLAEKWPEILAAIKVKNNPLYTILRLAKPHFSKEHLLLTFAFPFHQKRADDSKHKVIIAEVVQSVTGESLEVSTAVDKSQVSTPIEASNAPADPAHASLIASVQDIMGGGEVVNA
ncbi:MAG TPA: DNA polymerase III subunit gamma/tau [Candidatus Saccharibacteria bacterium]|nr:DNA polymerase III subunit gamma/tau [Candidatus Saccharibacteria bacterium]